MKTMPPINNKYPIDTIIKHIKRGSVYEITGTCIIESTIEFAYIYKCVSDGNAWVRPIDEIEDTNRFIVLPTIDQTIGSIDVKKVTDESGKVVGVVRSSNGRHTNIAIFDEEMIKKINSGTTHSCSMGHSYKGEYMDWFGNDKLFADIQYPSSTRLKFSVTPNEYKEQFTKHYHNVSEASKVVGAGENYHRIPCGIDSGRCPICEAIAAFENTAVDSIKNAQKPAPSSVPKPLTNNEKIAKFLNNLGDNDMTKAIRKSMQQFDLHGDNRSAILGAQTATVTDTSAIDELISRHPMKLSDAYKPTTYDPSKVKITYPDGKPVFPSIKEPVRKAQLTTSFVLTPDYIIKNVMPVLNKYGLHEVDAFSALFAKFRSDSDYKVELKVLDSKVFHMTPEIAVNLVISLFDKGHLK